ncbi:lipid-binding SYLF domain-containing protein [Falsiruegeria mediterranea]
MLRIGLVTVLVFLAGTATAEKLWDKVKKGAESAAETVGEGAQSVGSAVEQGAKVVGETVNSTTELVSNEDTPEATRARLDAMSEQILAQLLAENADARQLFDQSAGYAAFDSRKVTVFPVSAGYGRGVAVSGSNGARTYMNMGTGGVGAAFGIGGFVSKFVIMFETQADFDGFVTNGYDATAEAGTMQGQENSNETVRFIEGRSFFVLGKTGWRVNANASGTKYWPSPELN